MKNNVSRSLYRAILRKAKNYIPNLDYSRGILTVKDSDKYKSCYLDRYIIKKEDINTSVWGPYENRPLNIISWIKHEIREKPATNLQMESLFEVHRDLHHILNLSRYSHIIRDEY